MISPDPSAVFRPLENGGVILNVESGDYFQVNASGRFIWETLANGVEPGALIEALVAKFDVASEQATADIDVFLQNLDERSLVEITK